MSTSLVSLPSLPKFDVFSKKRLALQTVGYHVQDDANNRVLSHDVTAAILVSQNYQTAAMLVSQPVLWELNSFLMQTLSFVPINLPRC